MCFGRVGRFHVLSTRGDRIELPQSTERAVGKADFRSFQHARERGRCASDEEDDELQPQRIDSLRNRACLTAARRQEAVAERGREDRQMQSGGDNHKPDDGVLEAEEIAAAEQRIDGGLPQIIPGRKGKSLTRRSPRGPSGCPIAACSRTFCTSRATPSGRSPATRSLGCWFRRPFLP